MAYVFVLFDDHDTQFGLVNGNFTLLNPKLEPEQCGSIHLLNGQECYIMSPMAL